MARADKEWTERVKRLLKAELTRRDVTYQELAKLLKGIGVEGSTERNISNRISAGGFSAAFFFQCMEAIGAKTIHLDRDDD